MRSARAMADAEAGRRARRAWRLLVGAHDSTPAPRYGGALVVTAAAVLGAAFLPDDLTAYRVVTYLAAVALSALRGGVGPGLVSLALCAAAYRVSVGAAGSPWLEEPDPLHRLVFFASFGALGVWAASSLREGYRHTHARRRRAEARAHEQRIAAELGVKALSESDLPALLGETLAAVQRALACDSVTLLEVHGGATLRLRDVAGLGREIVGRAFGPAEAPLAFEALERREAVTVDDLAAEPSLASRALREAGIVSSLVAPVLAAGPSGRPFGTLGAHARRRRHFTADDAAFLQTAANVVGAAVMRLRAEDQVRDHLAFLRAIASSLAEGVYALDRDGRITFANPAAGRLLGWGAEELLGKRMHEVAHARGPDGAPCDPARCPILEVMRTGRPTQSQDDAFVRRDGTSLPIAYTASPLTAGGEVTGAVVAFQDFSEHVRAERATRFLDEATRQLAQSIDWQETLQRVARLAVPFLGDWSLVVVLDPDGNPRSLAAEAADPARADAARALLEQYPIDLRARHGVGRILRTGAAELIEDADPSSFVDSDGSPTAVRGELLARLGLRSYMGAPLRAGGRVLGAIAFAVAEGPRRYGAEDLAVAEALAQRCAFAIENARLYRAAQEATRTREEVMAVVSHDLKTPLGAMLMGAAMVERLAPDGGEGEALRRAAATVRRTAERMRRLIRDLVDFAALEAGGISIRPAPADAAGLGREAVEVLAGLAEEGGVALRLEAAPAVPIVCDRDRVLQVLTNLIANALHVTEPGGSVTLRVEPGESEVVFAVADTGPGIAAEDLTRVFERWYRGPDVRYAGSGLGLAIARAIVEAHGGRIWAESEVRRGSTFCFAIPREPPPSPR